MGKIRYEITNGTLPITVDLSPLALQNIHEDYGTYEFDNVDLGDYTLTFTDSSIPECIVELDINPCISCPDGFSLVENGCEKIDIVAATLHTPLYPLFARPKVEYGIKGTLIFDSFEVNGTGTFEKINPTNSYWINGPLNTSDGPMNRSAVWVSQIKNFQNIGFPVYIDIPIGKTYYIGVGCDDYASIYLNGQLLIQQDWGAVGAMLGATGFDIQRSLFNYWFIYPIELNAGKNVLEVVGTNSTGIYSAIGVEIYDATKNVLVNVTNDVELGNKLIFRSANEVGNNVAYEYSPSDGYHGYTCPEGYSLVTGDTPYCMKKLTIICGQASADPDLVTNNSSPDCSEVSFPIDVDLTLTKEFIMNSFFTPSRGVEEFEYIEIVRVINGPGSQSTYNGVNLYEGQIIDFSLYQTIDITMNNYSEASIVTEIDFKIKLLEESTLTQEVKYKFTNEGCNNTTELIIARVSLDSNLDGIYDLTKEIEIPFIVGEETTFTNPITASEYHYLLISIPSGMTFVILDSMNINISTLFTYENDDIRAGYVDNKIYKYQEPFGTSQPVTFKLTLTWND